MEHWRAFSKILGQLPLTIGQRIKLLRTKKPLEIPFSLFLFLKSSLIAVVIIVLKEEPAQPLLKVFSILQQTMMLIVMLGQCGLEFHLWTSSRNSPGQPAPQTLWGQAPGICILTSSLGDTDLC